MNISSLGLNVIQLLRMGCICSRERVTINGRPFTILERLGVGGFSYVDLVEDARSHEEYALKRITCHSPEDQRQAMNEVEFHRMLTHSGILELIDYDLRGKRDPLGNSTSELLMLLPYHRRGTLALDLERREKSRAFLAEKDIIRFFKSICDALLTFHTATPHPLAHRDLKTANILLDDNFNPIIMDFGSAARARVEIHDSMEAKHLEETAAERCSMPYRAPELFNIPSHASIDERTDIWSLGCILYAMCFFKSPYDIVHERGDSVALAVVSGRVNIPADSPFSEGLHNLIRFILVVDPKERPFLQDVIQRIKQLEANVQGCV